MRLGRQKENKSNLVFSLEKVDPSSSSSELPASSSSSNCQPSPSQRTLEIISGTTANGLGVTFASLSGNSLYYAPIVDFDGLPDQMLIYVSGDQVAAVTFNQPYLNTSFVLELVSGGASTFYCGTMISGEVNF